MQTRSGVLQGELSSAWRSRASSKCSSRRWLREQPRMRAGAGRGQRAGTRSPSVRSPRAPARRAPAVPSDRALEQIGGRAESNDRVSQPRGRMVMLAKCANASSGRPRPSSRVPLVRAARRRPKLGARARPPARSPHARALDSRPHDPETPRRGRAWPAGSSRSRPDRSPGRGAAPPSHWRPRPELPKPDLRGRQHLQGHGQLAHSPGGPQARPRGRAAGTPSQSRRAGRRQRLRRGDTSGSSKSSASPCARTSAATAGSWSPPSSKAVPSSRATSEELLVGLADRHARGQGGQARAEVERPRTSTPLPLARASRAPLRGRVGCLLRAGHQHVVGVLRLGRARTREPRRSALARGAPDRQAAVRPARPAARLFFFCGVRPASQLTSAAASSRRLLRRVVLAELRLRARALGGGGVAAAQARANRRMLLELVRDPHVGSRVAAARCHAPRSASASEGGGQRFFFVGEREVNAFALGEAGVAIDGRAHQRVAGSRSWRRPPARARPPPAG